jgi:hypothetical protein
VANSGPRSITKQHVLAVEGRTTGSSSTHCFVMSPSPRFKLSRLEARTNSRISCPRCSGRRVSARRMGLHLAIIRDKDEDDAFASVANIVTKAGLSPPLSHGQFSDGNPRVGIFIMPGVTVDGMMLEDLCLKTVEDDGAMDCVEEFASCVAALPDPPKNMSKAKVQVFKAHVFLATQPETVDSMGLGAQKGYWNLDSPCLDELKQFLLHLK